MTRDQILWLGVEPTPYVLALQACARAQLPFNADAAFERLDVSQTWELASGSFGVLNGVAAKARLLGRIARRAYRVVFLEGWGTGLLAAAGLTALAAGVPLIVSGDTWQASRGRGAFSMRRRVRRRLLAGAAATLPGGSRQRVFFLAEGARADRVVVRRMTVDAETLRRRSDELRPKRDAVRRSLDVPTAAVVALTAARLVPEKGVDLLLHAVAQVADTHLLVVGDGPVRPELEALAARLGLAGRVTWAGRLPHSDVVRAYVAADLFVLASRFEPWGLVVNEAMACGLPVIASSAVGCVDDLIVGTGAGIVVPAADTSALTEALTMFARDVEARQQAARRSTETIARWTFQEEVAAIRQALRLAVTR